jgi:hypothetical protein
MRADSKSLMYSAAIVQACLMPSREKEKVSEQQVTSEQNVLHRVHIHLFVLLHVHIEHY